MNVELQDLNKTKDRLFSIIGHDLKNPIHTIMGFMDLLNRREGKLTPETRNEYQGHISESIQNVSKLLDNLLEWSRAQRGTISFKQQQLDLSVSRKGTSGESGTGLGLLICKEFVEKHNGAIHVSSEPGKGSTFSFDLPRITS